MAWKKNEIISFEFAPQIWFWGAFVVYDFIHNLSKKW